MRSTVLALVVARFNPRPRAGGRLGFRLTHKIFVFVSIHAPVRGGDPVIAKGGNRTMFQSTPPCGGATPPTEHCPWFD